MRTTIILIMVCMGVLFPRHVLVQGDHAKPPPVPLGPNLTLSLFPPQKGKTGDRNPFISREQARLTLPASFGTHPLAIHRRRQHYQLLYERAPDPFIRYTYPDLLDANRAAVARLLRAPNIDEVVLVPNATVGVNTVLRALAEHWSPDGRDEVLYFSTIYGSCAKTVACVSDASRGLVRGRAVELVYPLSDAAVLSAFRAAAAASAAEGRRPRVAIFDTVSSLPGVRFPCEGLAAACRELGILSLVDGAQGVGMVPLDLGALDPDFFVSNCHKWLFVPRACAVFYVPRRNQHLIRSTVPTSHGYVPKDPVKALANPLPPSSKSAFVSNFEYVGTRDSSPYLCVGDAIEWREKVLGGEERIMRYNCSLAREGGSRVAEHLATWVMENEEGTLGDCAMTNVAMPLVVAPKRESEADYTLGQKEGSREEADVEEAAPENVLARSGKEKTEAGIESARAGETVIPFEDAERIWEWMTKVLVEEYKTFIPTYYHAGRFWARLSAQVYLDMDDFEWAGKTLRELCHRVAKKEYDT